MKSARSFFREINTIPNYVTILRLLFIPVLWAIFAKGLVTLAGASIILAMLTDILDGYLARKLNQTTSIGSKLDTLADNLLLSTALIWLFLLKPGLFSNNKVLFASWLIVYTTSILIGLVKFKCFPHLHLYSSKIATGATYLFFVVTYAFDCTSEAFFVTTLCLAIISSAEVALILLVKSEYENDVGSIVNVLLRL